MNDFAIGPLGRLTHLGLLRFTGPDALTFLQGQLSSDTRQLAQNKPLLSAYSTPQGRVLAVVYLLPHSSGTLAILPRELLQDTAQRLRKFVMRTKVVIEDVSDSFALLGAHSAQSLAALGVGFDAGERQYLERDGVGVAPVNRDLNRFWVTGPAERFAQLEVGDVAGLEAAWRLADVRAGLPQVYVSTRETFIAQMLNLDLLDGISFSKGCYTGQEIIARTQHLGRIKRRMFHLGLPEGSWSVGQPIRLSDGRHGRIAELAAGSEGAEALAVLNLEATADSEEASAAIVHAKEIALPYALTLTDR
jgi:tRNA-modifying protein YgfZ